MYTAPNFSREEQDWITSFDDSQACRWLVAYARAINTLDIASLKNTLGRSVRYESQSVFDQIIGPRALLDYWEQKFRSILASTNRVVAELALFPDGKPCARLFQAASDHDTNWLDRPGAAMTVATDRYGKANSLLMVTGVPSPHMTQGSGIFPGLATAPSARPQRFVRHSPRFDEITLYVFYLNGEVTLDRAMAESVACARRELEGLLVVELKTSEQDFSPEWEALERLRFLGFPSVGAFYNGSPIYRHEGLIDGATLVAELRKAAPLFLAE